MSSKKLTPETNVVVNPPLGSHLMLSPAPVPTENPWNRKPKPLGDNNNISNFKHKTFSAQHNKSNSVIKSALHENLKSDILSCENAVNVPSLYYKSKPNIIHDSTGYCNLKPKKKKFSKFRNENANCNTKSLKINDSFIVYEQEAIKKANLNLPEIISYSTVNSDNKVIEPLSSQFNKLNVSETIKNNLKESFAGNFSSSSLTNIIPKELTESANNVTGEIGTTFLSKASNSVAKISVPAFSGTGTTSPTNNDLKTLNKEAEIDFNKYSEKNSFNFFKRSNSRSTRQKKKSSLNNNEYPDYSKNVESYPQPFYSPVAPNFTSPPMFPQILPPDNFQNHQTLPSNSYLMNNMYSPNYMMVPNQFFKPHHPPISTLSFIFNNEAYTYSPGKRSSEFSSPDTSFDAYETSTNISQTRSHYGDNDNTMGRNISKTCGTVNHMSPVMMQMPLYQFNGPISPQPFHSINSQAEFIPTVSMNPIISSPIFQQCVMSPQAPQTGHFITNPNSFYDNFLSNDYHETMNDSYESMEKDPEFMRVANSVKRQLEYYFSLENLMNDQFLRRLMNVTTGGIPLEKILKFKKLQSIIYNEAQKESYTKEELNYGLDLIKCAVSMADDLILINENKELRIKNNWKNFIWKPKYS